MPEFDLDQDYFPPGSGGSAAARAVGRRVAARRLTGRSLSATVAAVVVLHGLCRMWFGRGVLGAIGLVLALASTGPVRAEATRDKCTCDLRTAGDRQDGAEVRNAAACYLSFDRNRDWCSFDVSALNGSQRHQTVLRDTAELFEATDDPLAALWPLIAGYLSRPDVRENLASRFDVDARAALEQAESATKDNWELLSACLDAFFSGAAGDFRVMQEGDGLACGVDPETGWLNLEYRFDSWLLIFLSEPLRS